MTDFLEKITEASEEEVSERKESNIVIKDSLGNSYFPVTSKIYTGEEAIDKEEGSIFFKENRLFIVVEKGLAKELAFTDELNNTVEELEKIKELLELATGNTEEIERIVGEKIQEEATKREELKSELTSKIQDLSERHDKEVTTIVGDVISQMTDEETSSAYKTLKEITKDLQDNEASVKDILAKIDEKGTKNEELEKAIKEIEELVESSIKEEDLEAYVKKEEYDKKVLELEEMKKLVPVLDREEKTLTFFNVK